MCAFHPKQTMRASACVSQAYRKRSDFSVLRVVFRYKKCAKLRETASVPAIALQRSGVRFPPASPALVVDNQNNSGSGCSRGNRGEGTGLLPNSSRPDGPGRAAVQIGQSAPSSRQLIANQASPRPISSRGNVIPSYWMSAGCRPILRQPCANPAFRHSTTARPPTWCCRTERRSSSVPM
jgi:hypothetical protein